MNHPRQREMWDGLTPNGCLFLIGFFLALTAIGEWFFG